MRDLLTGIPVSTVTEEMKALSTFVEFVRVAEHTGVGRLLTSAPNQLLLRFIGP